MATEQHYAVVFKLEFPPGQHWDVTAKAEDPRFASDIRQHWKVGDLWSIGTESTLANPMPCWLEAIPIDGPLEAGDTWDRDAKAIVKWHANKTQLQERIAAHQAEIDRLTPYL